MRQTIFLLQAILMFRFCGPRQRAKRSLGIWTSIQLEEEKGSNVVQDKIRQHYIRYLNMDMVDLPLMVIHYFLFFFSVYLLYMSIDRLFFHGPMSSLSFY